MEFTITKEQILEVAKWGDSQNEKQIKEWFPEAFESELEEWIPVLNYEGFYEVSNFGNVRSLSREVKHSRNPNFIKKVEGRLLVPSLHNKGYYKVRLSKYGKKETKLIHHLVALSFLNHTTSSNICIDHINENKLNNRLDNLQIISKQENTKKSFDFKLDQFKEGDYWFHNTGALNLIIEVTKTHGGTIKCKPIHSDSENYSFHRINVMNRKATHEEVEEALVEEAKKRGFVNGAKFKSSLSEDGRIRTVRENGSWFFHIQFNKLNLSTPEYEWEDSQSNPVIFDNGKWAEILPEEKTTISKEKALRIIAKKLKVSPENIEIK